MTTVTTFELAHLIRSTEVDKFLESPDQVNHVIEKNLSL